jgi:cytochrome c oxidase subunit 2
VEWTPNDIRVPVGATVEFLVTSRDVAHGLLVDGTDVNLTVIPGRVSQTTYRFLRPGTYLFLCEEYCGLGHQTMGGHITAEGPAQ